MLQRKSIAATLFVVLPLATLSSCGFDYATDRVNQIGAGSNNRDASVDVLGIRVLAHEDGRGRLIGTLVNNGDEPASLVAIEGEDATGEVPQIEVPADGLVNLAAEDVGVIPMSGEFEPGDVIDLEFTFDTDETVELPVPVVKNCFQYTAVPEPTSEAPEVTEPADPTEGIEETGTTEGTGATEGTSTPEATEEAEAHAEETHAEQPTDPAYLCEHETEHAEH